MKILTIVGARPQFIKSAPVSQALRAAELQEIVVHTGQHYDSTMSAVFFEDLGLSEPAYHLGVGSGPHGQQTGRMLEAIEKVAQREMPGWVLIYGDTNSTLAGALAAAKLHIPIAHVEAGLRSFNRRMPEEVNRVVADQLSTLLFASTDVAVRNLVAEGIASEKIRQVGDVMFDATVMFAAKAERQSTILDQHKLAPKSFALATVHRAENTDVRDHLEAIFKGLTELSKDIRVVLPLHPRTSGALVPELQKRFTAAGGLLIDPAGYLDMLMLERHAALVITDSGGVQKEAFFQRVPCITLREETEWTELVELGWNTLLSPKRAQELPQLAAAVRGKIGATASPYGDGSASRLIAAWLASKGASLITNYSLSTASA